MKAVCPIHRWLILDQDQFAHDWGDEQTLVVAIHPKSQRTAVISIPDGNCQQAIQSLEDLSRSWPDGHESVEIKDCQVKFIAPESCRDALLANFDRLNVRAQGKFIQAHSKLEFFILPTGVIRIEKRQADTAVKGPRASSQGPVKVMIVDDSPTVRKILRGMIEKDPQLEVVAETGQPQEVQDLIGRFSPDVLTLDIQMPVMNGVDLLEKIYQHRFVPAVVVSALSLQAGSLVIEALEKGAFDYVQKPSMKEIPILAPVLNKKLKLAARSPDRRHEEVSEKHGGQTLHQPIDKRKLILIGASTGGTEAIKMVLSGLPSEIPPILIAQHIPPLFSNAFAQRLNEMMPFSVKEAEEGDPVQANSVLIAPGGYHMRIKKESQGSVVTLVDGEQDKQPHTPSVDVLFESLEKGDAEHAAAVLLTGMGKDGAEGLLSLKKNGAFTLAQNEETCVVFGMPKEAIKLEAPQEVLPLPKMSRRLFEWLSSSSAQKKAG